METYQLECDGIELYFCSPHDCNFKDLEYGKSLNDYYACTAKFLADLDDESTSQETKCIVIPSEKNNTVQVKNILAQYPDSYYMGVKFKVSVRDGKQELKMTKHTRKVLADSNDLVFIIGKSGEFIYSDDEVCGRVLKSIFEYTYDTEALRSDKLEAAQEERYSVTSISYMNSLTADMIKEHWGGFELFILEDGTTTEIRLDDCLKYIPDSKNSIVYKDDKPIEIHYFSEAIDSSNQININVTNGINVNTPSTYSNEEQ